MHTINRHHDSAWPYYLHLTYANCSRVMQAFRNIWIKKHRFLREAVVEILVHHRPTTRWLRANAALRSKYYTQSSFQLACSYVALTSSKSHRSSSFLSKNYSDGIRTRQDKELEQGAIKKARSITCLSSSSNRAATLITHLFSQKQVLYSELENQESLH